MHSGFLLTHCEKSMVINLTVTRLYDITELFGTGESLWNTK